MSKGLVIVVTGANGGVGFGICHRLLVQLSSPHPSDAQPFFKVVGADAVPSHGILDEYEFSPDAGVTIIMACRDPRRAQDARTRLYRLLDEHVAGLSPGTKEQAYAAAFRKTVKLELEILDLSSVKSVLDFGRRASDKYEYLSHLIFNAGTATYSHLDLLGFTLDFLRFPIHAIQHPRRNIQVNGVLSKDNLGYTWQCNIFGHYVLYRSLQDLLVAYSNFTSRSARVLWMSSLDSEPVFDPKDDWQLTKTYHSYQASKFQIDLIASELEKRTVEALEAGRVSSMEETVAPHGEIHHLIVSPGIISTNMSSLLNIWIPGYQYLMAVAFWLVRFLGAPHVLMSVFSAAFSAVHLALVPLRHVPTVRNSPQISPLDVEYPFWHRYHGKTSTRVQALRFGSENDRWGNDRPGVIAVPVWDEHPNAGEVLLERFERLYQAFDMANADRERAENGNGYAKGNGKAR
ncbi:hypothetical protein GSI_12190 [Ganoderma sinense ZZ0214-1]|uniref:3-keto sterol reductase n=1 Tax=Ganoderma sinense ZZ0214-1 TaxID=1077348 RepID=A0A2G8RY48_9APHY|nr:hypothetical protein GSI_12190 [Ganoderma sinense ZZ0214-1]